MAANWFSQSQNPHTYWLWRQQQQIHNIHNKWIIDNKTETRMFEFKCLGQLFIYFFTIILLLFLSIIFYPSIFIYKAQEMHKI